VQQQTVLPTAAAVAAAVAAAAAGLVASTTRPLPVPRHLAADSISGLTSASIGGLNALMAEVDAAGRQPGTHGSNGADVPGGRVDGRLTTAAADPEIGKQASGMQAFGQVRCRICQLVQDAGSRSMWHCATAPQWLQSCWQGW